MNSSATIEAKAPPVTLLVEEELTEQLLADGEPPLLTEEATPAVAFPRRPDRLLAALIFGGVLLIGVAGGAILFHGPSGFRNDAASAESPAAETAVAKPEDAAAIANRQQPEDIAASAAAGNERASSQVPAPIEKPEQTPQVAEPKPPAVVARAPMSALEAAVAAERVRPATARSAQPHVQSSQHQAATRPVKTAECSLIGADMATFRKCVENFNQ
jgi:hypothetical protein